MGITQGYQEMLTSLSPTLRAIIGDLSALSTTRGWVQMEVYSWLPLLLAYYAAASAVAVVTREIDRGSYEFLFALPVPRWKVVLGRVAALVLGLFVVHAGLFFAVWGGLLWIGQPPEPLVYLRPAALSFALLFSLSMLCLLLSAFLSDSGRALFTGIGAVFGLYILNFGLKAANKGEWLRKWSFFGRYTFDASLKAAGFPWEDFLVLTIYGLVLLGASVALFERRELTP
jgi:ABC-type transport system involved in multi-copper enzyme maturation permease subunit